MTWRGGWAQGMLPVLLLGCGEDVMSCTLVDCLDGFSINAVRPLAEGATSVEPLPEGDYEIALTLDGRSVVCHRTVPLAAPEDCKGPPLVVDGGVRMADGVQVAFAIEVREAPRSATVAIRYQGTLVGEASYTPEYRTSAPNGVECGPVCRFAAPLRLELNF